MERDPRYTRQFDKWSLEQLEAASEAVGALVNQPGWLLLTELVEYEIASLDALLDGDRDDLSHTQYAKAHGRRSGLRYMEGAAMALLIRAEAKLREQREKHEGSREGELERI